MEKYPQVLIMIETFHKQSGGGITLSNLFEGWDSSCLANAVTIHYWDRIKTNEHCNNYYFLGNDEYKVSFPFSLYFKVGKSGKIDSNKEKSNSTSVSKLKLFILNILKPPMRWLIDFFNLSNVIFSMEVSPQFLNWLKDFSPDYIYVQPSGRTNMNFFKKLHEISGVPLVMHIMDDWQNAKNSGFLTNYWKKKIEKEFKELLDMTSVYLSISEGMSEEYYKRYGKVFIPFHNTVELAKWLPYSKKSVVINKNEVRILYAGRIGIGTNHAFLDLINAIEELNKLTQLKISINIQTSDAERSLNKKLLEYKCVSFNPFIEYSELPKLFASYDLLLLPIDFEIGGLSYLKFSMPTKVPEFMISGAPILLYCPEQVYLHSHAKKHNWAYVIDKNDPKNIKEGILELINNEEIRRSISKTAVDFAKKNYNSEFVRVNFLLNFNKKIKK
jgi:glycosyltransferase involved in cell wall biosynthesis